MSWVSTGNPSSSWSAVQRNTRAWRYSAASAARRCCSTSSSTASHMRSASSLLAGTPNRRSGAASSCGPDPAATVSSLGTGPDGCIDTGPERSGPEAGPLGSMTPGRSLTSGAAPSVARAGAAPSVRTGPETSADRIGAAPSVVGPGAAVGAATGATTVSYTHLTLPTSDLV